MLMGVTVTRELLANAAGVLSILLVLLASPLLLGCYVVVQRAGAITQLVWFGGVLLLLAGALVIGAAGLVLLG
jgi:uncharacterized membrane protein YedE/YeeE